MNMIEQEFLLRIPTSLITESHGVTITLPAGDYRAEKVASLGRDGAHDQYLLHPLKRTRAHAISGDMLQMLMHDNRIRVLAEG